MTCGPSRQQPRLDESAVRDPIIVPRFIKSDVTSEFQARFSLHVTHVSRDIDAHLHVISDRDVDLVRRGTGSVVLVRCGTRSDSHFRVHRTVHTGE